MTTMEEQCGDKQDASNCRQWWQFRTQLERRLLIIVIAMSLALFTIMTYAFFIHITSESTPPVCMSNDCVQTAAKFLTSIDAEADPCQDFTRFACGNFFATSHTNSTYSELTQSEILARKRLERVFYEPTTTTNKDFSEDVDVSVKNLRYLFRTCMNRSVIDEGVALLKRELIAKLGGWPLISNNWDEGFTGHTGALNFNWIWLNFLTKLRDMGFRSDIFFSFRLHANYTDNRNYLMLIPPILDAAAMSKEFRKENEAFLYRTLEAFGGDRMRAAYDINYLGDFTLELIKVMSKYNNITKVEPKLITLREVENLTQSSQIDWIHLLSTLTGWKQLNSSDSVVFDVNMREYMRELQALLKKTPRRVLVNYIIWEVLKDVQLWYNVPNAPKVTLLERRHLCMEEVNKLMPLIANQHLARKHIHRDEVKAMILTIRDVIITKIHNLKWFDVNSTMKTLLENKLKNVQFFIAGKLENNNFKIDYGEEDISNNTNYIQAISKIKLTSDNYHFDVVLNKTTLETTLIRLLGMDVSANAFYLNNNIIAIPTGLIQQLYSNTLPDYINYARLGHLIGHELSHIFSLFAQKYGVHGEPNPLWSDSLIEDYNKHHKCLINEYELYSLDKYKTKLNGTATLDENMADIIGTHAAYEVFKTLETTNSIKNLNLPAINNYTPKQLFWISFARYYCDPQEAVQILTSKSSHHLNAIHGIPSFRIFSTLSKSHQFAVDFKCNKGSRMNPLRLKKCNI